MESVLVEILSVEASIRNELESGNVHSPMSQMHGDRRFQGRVGSGRGCVDVPLPSQGPSFIPDPQGVDLGFPLISCRFWVVASVSGSGHSDAQ